MGIGKTAISSSSYSSSSSLERPTARLVGPENMIHSPNCFTLPCTGPFHKINAGYEATTTTVNSSCQMYIRLVFRRHFTKLTRDQGTAHANQCMYACTYIKYTIHYENPSFTFNSNLTTGMDRPHQNTYSIKKMS